MTATITPVSQHDSATLTRAVAGERMMMDGGASPLATILQKFADRCDFARDAAIGGLSWSGDFSVAGSAANNFTVTLGAINSAVILLGSTYKTFSSSGATPGQTKVEGGGGTLGAVARWWYVYAYSNAGTLDYEISQTAPHASRKFKSGDFTRLYLGCFPTLSTGVPIPLRAVRGRYVYRSSASAAADTLVLNAGSATANTAVDCAALVPPHSRLATIRAQLTSTAAAFNYAYLRTEGESGADEHLIPLPNLNTADAVYVADIETDADQDIAYRVTNVSSAPSLSLWVAGFYE